MSSIPIFTLIGFTVENVMLHLVPQYVHPGGAYVKRMLVVHPGFERDLLGSNMDPNLVQRMFTCWCLPQLVSVFRCIHSDLLPAQRRSVMRHIAPGFPRRSRI